MKLDKRIKALTDIQSVTNGCHDWEFMTKKGYFANSIFDFKDLKRTCVYGEYAGYREHDKCFHCEVILPDGTTDYNWFSYFLPEDSLLPEEKPEKKYRPYSLNEFLEQYKIGETVTFRLKKDEHILEAECRVEYKRMVTGYETLPEDRDQPGKSSILLGGCPPTGLARLFEFYEIKNEYSVPTVWLPFGVLDKENE